MTTTNLCEGCLSTLDGCPVHGEHGSNPNEKFRDLRLPPIGLSIDKILAEIGGEARHAMANWSAMNSAHEGFAVLYEEVDELWDHVRTNQKKRDIPAMRKECIQIAAIALRFAIEVCNEEVGRR